jgi:hypothetical protein
MTILYQNTGYMVSSRRGLTWYEELMIEDTSYTHICDYDTEITFPEEIFCTQYIHNYKKTNLTCSICKIQCKLIAIISVSQVVALIFLFQLIG